jgi:hypothetical protein
MLQALPENICRRLHLVTKKTGFVLAATLALALSIGANTAIFSFDCSALVCIHSQETVPHQYTTNNR